LRAAWAPAPFWSATVVKSSSPCTPWWRPSEGGRTYGGDAVPGHGLQVGECLGRCLGGGCQLAQAGAELGFGHGVEVYAAQDFPAGSWEPWSVGTWT
jgi:hypothetical protein